jgi:hypothetical protein
MIGDPVFKPKEYFGTIEILRSGFPKVYSPFRHKGEIRYRKFKRELKNGNGLSELDMIDIWAEKNITELAKKLNSSLFCDEE